jgi:hypothetical protein
VALAVAVAQALTALRTLVLSYFGEPVALDRLTFFLPYLVYLGIVVAAVAVMHEEPLPGVDEDWLIRPIRRRDLALSKLLFVLLMIHAPILVIDVGQQLMLHFGFWGSLGVAALRSVNLLFVLSLPAVLLGAITKSFVNAFVFATGATIVGFLLFPLSLWAMRPGLIGNPSPPTQWISVIGAGVVMAIGAITALAYQYRTRRTPTSRVLAVAAALVAFGLFAAIPGTATLRVQEWLWGSAGANGIVLSLDPDVQRPTVASAAPVNSDRGGVPAAVLAARATEARLVNKQLERVRVPLRVSGMSAGDVLFAERVGVRITAASDGAVLYRGTGVCVRGSNGVGVGCLNNSLEVWPGAQKGSDLLGEQRLNLPVALYERIKDLAVRVELTYTLTRFAAQPSQALDAAGEQRPLPEMGSCATRIDEDGDEIELGCLTNIGVPSCAAAMIYDPQTNKHNPELHLCFPNYSPFHRMAFEDAVGRSHLSLPFHDRTGLAHYPVDSAAIEHSRILLTTYDPVEHFRRLLVIPSIRLSDWRLPDGAS